MCLSLSLKQSPTTLARADFDMHIEDDLDPNTSYLYQAGFEDRLEAFQTGQFSFIGVYASISLSVAGQIVTLRSPGLWGIESDSGQEWLKIVFLDEVEILTEALQQDGFNVTLDHDAEDLRLSTALKDNSR